MRVLEGCPGGVQREPGRGFDRRVGKVQLQSFAFTWDEGKNNGEVNTCSKRRKQTFFFFNEREDVKNTTYREEVTEQNKNQNVEKR